VEAVLLLGDVIGVILVLVWVVRGRPTEGLFSWRSVPNQDPAPENGGGRHGVRKPDARRKHSPGQVGSRIR
jgi:hypothetical protein